MKKARNLETGELLSLQRFYELEGKSDRNQIGPNGRRGWTTQIACPDCGAPVHPNDAKGALGIELTSQELTAPKKRDFSSVATEATERRRKKPGFDHHDHKASADCPSNYANSPLFKKSFADKTFDGKEADRNAEVLKDPRTEQTLFSIYEHMMKRLTGHSKLEEADRQAYEKWTKRLMPMVGLADHPWILPYMVAVLTGTHARMFSRLTHPRKVGFRPFGRQTLVGHDVEGKAYSFTFPQSISPCFLGKSGSATPMMNPQTRQITSFRIEKPNTLIQLPKKADKTSEVKGAPAVPAQLAVTRSETLPVAANDQMKRSTPKSKKTTASNQLTFDW